MAKLSDIKRALAVKKSEGVSSAEAMERAKAERYAKKEAGEEYQATKAANLPMFKRARQRVATIKASQAAAAGQAGIKQIVAGGTASPGTVNPFLPLPLRRSI